MGLVLYAMSVMNNLSHQILGRRNCQIFFLRDDGMDLFFTKREREKEKKRESEKSNFLQREKERNKGKNNTYFPRTKNYELRTQN